MERVKKGEKYWFISASSFFDSHIVMWRCDMRGVRDDKFFNGGNYFHTKEEAETMARKLRAVLKGADVIEMPSEEEIRRGYAITMSDTLVNDSSLDLRTSAVMWDEAIKWLKSKVK